MNESFQSGLRRRAFLQKMGMGFGGAALASMMHRDAGAAEPGLQPTHFAPKAKHVI